MLGRRRKNGEPDMPRAPIRLATAALCALAPLAALADPTAEQAASLQQQLRGWLDTAFGIKFALPIDVAAESDHYRISSRLVSFPGMSNVQGGDLSVSAQPTSDGRWIISDYRLTSPIKFKVDLSAMGAGNSAAGPGGAVDMTISIGKVAADAIFDPNLATPSTMSTRIDGYEFASGTGEVQQVTRSGPAIGKAALIPTGNGRIDVTVETMVNDLSSITSAGEQKSIALFLGRAQQSVQVKGLDWERAAKLIRSVVQIANARLGNPDGAPDTSGAPPEPSTAAKPDLQSPRDLYMMVRGIVTGGEFADTLEDLRVEAGGHLVGVGRIGFGGGVDSPNGMLTAHLLVSADGVASPEIPPEAREYIPRHVLIEPRLAGVSLADLDALIMAATAPGVEPSLDQPEIAKQIAALFAHGGITAGLDQFEIDLGRTHLGATGKITALALDSFKGEAEVVATGFDAVIEHAQKTPDLAKAAPFLQLLGKIGQADGSRIVWKITGDNTAVKINGLDLTALVAAGNSENKRPR
jgi:hypothetical protein